MNTEECCNHNCNQGRDCPLRKAKINNEPVAWMARNELLFSVVKDEIHYIPLYTHPVKELTDEEVHDLIINKTTDADMIKQALRKAQEK